MTTQNIVATNVASTSEAIYGKLGKLSSIKRTIQRNRPKQFATNPKSLADFEVPDELKKNVCWSIIFAVRLRAK